MKTLLTLLILTMATCAMAQSNAPVMLLLDGNGNPFPDGAGTPPQSTAPPATCVTNIGGTLQYCDFTSGILPNPANFHGPITAPSINGDIAVDGTVYTTINAAWTACQNKAANCALQVPAGSFALSSTLTEPEASYSTSIFGRGSDKTYIWASAAMANMVFKANTTVGAPFVIQGVTLACNSGSTINAQVGLKLQWARYIILSDVRVINCGTVDIDFGEDHGTSNQFGGTFYNLFTNYDEAIFSGPAGGSGPTPPSYGILLRNSAVDSNYYKAIVRNASVASLHMDGANNTLYDFHGFGFSATNPVNYDEQYVVEEGTLAVGNTYYGTYFDSPTVSGLHFMQASGVSTDSSFLGGKFYWSPPIGSYPTTANLVTIDNSNLTDAVVKDFSCSGMPNTSSAFSGAGGFGTHTNFSNITGCVSPFMIYRFEPTNRGYNWSNQPTVFTNQWSGVEGRYAPTQNGTFTWSWLDSAKVTRVNISDQGLIVASRLATTVGAPIASAATIAPASISGVFHITGTTPISTITPPTGCTGFTGCELRIIPDAIFSTLTTGNIAIASTAVVSKLLIMTYDPATAKWYPSYTN